MEGVGVLAMEVVVSVVFVVVVFVDGGVPVTLVVLVNDELAGTYELDVVILVIGVKVRSGVGVGTDSAIIGVLGTDV